MSLGRSVSFSELGDDPGVSVENPPEGKKIDPLLVNKAYTLDSYAKLRYSMNNQGEKRKKSIFASFRLSKKNSGSIKEKDISSSDVSSTNEKENESLQDCTAEKDGKSNDDHHRKFKRHYLTRVSSFVNRVTNRVQTNNDEHPLTSHRKLERSQTITGNDFLPEKIEYVKYDSAVPGLMGIRNHGNTCFLSAVIQCLNHTDPLAEYFILDLYKSDLARSNRINSKKYGSKGEITEQLALLLKSLWILRYSPDISLKLKTIVEKFEPCYKGSNQHDAAEFLMFLLDKVHEDLNTASKRKYKKIKNSYGRPDEIVAAETLANYLRCNSSFVQAIFQAQFRSSLRCPLCLRESNTFDPYLFVSIPIPQKEVRSIYVTVVYLNQQPKQVKLGVSILASSPVKLLRETLASDCGVATEHLVLTEVDGEGFHRTFADNGCVNIISTTDPIYAIEMTPPSSQGSDAFILITWVNVLLSDPENIRFGGVYQSQISRDISYSDLQKLLLKEMSTMVSLETLVTEQENGTFFIAVDTGGSSVTLDIGLDMPLLHESIEEALSLCHPLSGPPHIKLVLQWTKETKERYIVDDVDHVDEHASIDELKKKPTEYAPVTLNECLQLHTSSEMLSSGDEWHCPTCNRKQQVLKRLLLWSAPQILVLHLKRFRQVSLSANSSKLNTIVTFPLNGFDISEHMAWRHCSNNPTLPLVDNSQTSNRGFASVWSPWKKPKKLDSSCANEFVYDLYAVCNHHGRDLQGGHYTAVCRNPTNHKWYCFDDFNYEEVSQDDVIAQDAYILFYQKREDANMHCFAFNSGESHWSQRIPFSNLPAQLKSTIPANNQTLPSPQIDRRESSPEDAESFSKAQTNEEHNGSFDDSTATNHNNNKLILGIETAQIEVNCEDKDLGNMNISEDSAEKMTEIKLEDNIEPPKEFRSLGDHGEDFCNPLPHGIDSKLGKEEEASRQETNKEEAIPEVRIQPASLEVIASHRQRASVAKQNSNTKISSKSKVQENCNSRPTSICSSTRSSLSESSLSGTEINEHNKEDSSPSQDDTSEVNNDVKSGKKSKPNHRRTNTNKIPSYVVINTPTSSPRYVRSRPAPSNRSRAHLKSESESSRSTPKDTSSIAGNKCHSYPSAERELLPSFSGLYKPRGANSKSSSTSSEINSYIAKRPNCKICNSKTTPKSPDSYHYATESSV